MLRRAESRERRGLSDKMVERVFPWSKLSPVMGEPGVIEQGKQASLRQLASTMLDLPLGITAAHSDIELNDGPVIPVIRRCPRQPRRGLR
ncbi:MAG: hypothetical protein AMK72_01375 [Planctomycetes bacterium SM23_25]|nr:MAG: hypothetical protein AMS14_01975 [Planctomycetes bacterium DG_20]KPK50778.1 MAG: hypothetical protein AMK72_01375 [Planctomycetes bacterium SM23_25]